MASSCWAGRHFVMLGAGGDAELPEFAVQVMHEFGDFQTQTREILVFQLLPLRRFGAEQRAAGQNKVEAFFIQFAVDDEVFLLRADGSHNLLGGGVAQGFQHAHRLFAQRFHRAEQRSFFIKDLAGEREESRGDVERAFFYECRRGAVPGCIAAGFGGVAQTAGRERRGVGLTFDEFLAGEFQYGLAVVRGRNERIVFFCGNAGHRHEPVREVRGAFLDGPIFHGRGDFVRDRGIDRQARFDGLFERFVRRFGEVCAHHGIVKYVFAENVGRCDNSVFLHFPILLKNIKKTLHSTCETSLFPLEKPTLSFLKYQYIIWHI